MYNYLLKRMFADYTARSNGNNIDFFDGYSIVGTWFKKEEVLNIFLVASSKVVWNHIGLATFVVTKKYSVLDKGKARKAEAAWIIGNCGASYFKTLADSLYIDSQHAFDDVRAKGISIIKGIGNRLTFTLFGIKVEWLDSEMECFGNVFYLNPAIIYPIRHRGHKLRNATEYLRKEFDWNYNAGYYTAGSFETRLFIDYIARKTNHLDLSSIKYRKTDLYM